MKEDALKFPRPLCASHCTVLEFSKLAENGMFDQLRSQFINFLFTWIKTAWTQWQSSQDMNKKSGDKLQWQVGEICKISPSSLAGFKKKILVLWMWYYARHFWTNYAAAKSLQSCRTLRPRRWQPTRLLCPWDSSGKNIGVGCMMSLQKESLASIRIKDCWPCMTPPLPPLSSMHNLRYKNYFGK